MTMMPRFFGYFRFFGYAFEGLIHMVKHHRSFQIQLVVGWFVLFLGWRLEISRSDWRLIILVVFLVLVAEMLNTTVEKTLDYMAKEHHMDVKIAKDVAAGAVLMSSFGALLIGLLIFLPQILG